jgi:hypothetical protein
MLTNLAWFNVFKKIKKIIKKVKKEPKKENFDFFA